MKSIWADILEILILIPFKLIEIILSLFGFILLLTVHPIILIIREIKGNGRKSKSSSAL